MSTHAISLDVTRSERLSRLHVLVRLAAVCVLGAFEYSLSWPWWAAYLMLPLLALALVSEKGPARYLAEDGRWMSAVLRWFLAAHAYLLLLTDGLPDQDYEHRVELEAHFTAAPTPGSAALRWLTSIPAGLLLIILSIPSFFVWLASMLVVALTASLPSSLHRFQVAILQFEARLFAYHASLTDEYPPFTMDVGTPHGSNFPQGTHLPHGGAV